MHRLTYLTNALPSIIASPRRAPLRRGLFLIALLLACSALLPSVQAAPDPAPPPGNNTRDGQGAMANITTGQFNTAFGTNALFSLTTGSNNGAQGNSALFSNTIGSGNVAVGSIALRLNVDGIHNTAIGNTALNNNVHGNHNTAVGYGTLRNNTESDNTAVGYLALRDNTTGDDDNAFGFNALIHNTVGTFNNAHGRSALESNTEGSENNAFGDLALEDVTTGNSNTAIGDDALRNLEDGSFNVAVGDEAGTGLGVSVSNCIAIGAPGDGPFADLDNTCFIGSIFGQPVSDPGTQAAVYVDQFNVVGIMNSSRRFKHDIEPMDKTSETLYQLKPVTFKYNGDWKASTQYGLIAEEVAEVNPGLVVRAKDGEVQTVRYEQINTMLLNEFLKEHKKVQSLEVTVALQQKGMEVLTAQLKEQAAQIQKVSARVELNKGAPRTVANK